MDDNDSLLSEDESVPFGEPGGNVKVGLFDALRGLPIIARPVGGGLLCAFVAEGVML